MRFEWNNAGVRWMAGLAAMLCWFGTAGAADRPPHPLVWSTLERVIETKPGQANAEFEFTVVNVSNAPVTIEEIRPTCGCTVVEMPTRPWVVPPRGSGTFTGLIDLRGVDADETKALFVNSAAGTQVLRVTVRIPVKDKATPSAKKSEPPRAGK